MNRTDTQLPRPLLKNQHYARDEGVHLSFETESVAPCAPVVQTQCHRRAEPPVELNGCNVHFTAFDQPFRQVYR